MSGLLALLDDVAALTKLAAAQLDDVAAHAAKAGTKVAGVVIDDGAVTPKYLHGLPAAREIPIVMKIARGSVFNKIVILLPAALLLNAFFPWLLTPLLMLGGAYLCFEGAEKILHWLVPSKDHGPKPETLDAAHLERERVAGAIKTDFILSAEIMTIALATVEAETVWMQAAVLALIAVGITALVYGTVAILVKADDWGLKLSQIGEWSVTRSIGRGIVKSMPSVMAFIATVGTAAMLWVGGSIVIHGVEVLGWTAIGHFIHDAAAAVGHAFPAAGGTLEWIAKATLDGVFGLAVGFAVMPIAHYVITPLIEFGKGLFPQGRPPVEG